VDQNRTIKQRIDNIANIPTLPLVIEKITRLLQNPATSAEEVGRAITTDQAIASKVLRLVNSAFYGFPGRISTITHAIVILGFSTVKNIVLTASIFDFFKSRDEAHPEFDLEQFWLHSIACGAASQAIAKYAGYAEKEESFIGGLIHDVGKIILCQYLPDELSRVVQQVKKKDSLFYEGEMEVLGLTHQEIGGIVVQRWNLPKNLQEVVKYHHQPSPSREFFAITSIVHCADVLVRALEVGWGGDVRVPMVSEAAWQKLGLSNISLSVLLEEIDNEIRKASTLLQVM